MFYYQSIINSHLNTLESGKGKTGKKAKPEPSREEMHAVVVDILKQVDFNTVSSASYPGIAPDSIGQLSCSYCSQNFSPFF